MLRKFTKRVTSEVGGAQTAYIGPLSGYVHQICYKKIDYADGVDFTITVEGTGENIWVQSDVNAAAIVAPRRPVHSLVGVAATLDGTRPMLDKVALSRDRIKIVLAQAGDGKIGDFEVIIDDG